MSRWFHFSATRTLVAGAILCVGFAFHFQARPAYPAPHAGVVVEQSYDQAIWDSSAYYVAAVWEAAFGVCLALAVGVMSRRTWSSLVAAIIAVLPALWLMRSIYLD
jgi:hypothetical protein